jgi:hypothetical protein
VESWIGKFHPWPRYATNLPSSPAWNNSTSAPIISISAIYGKTRWTHAWLELFRSFTSVKTLRISGELGPHVAPALEVVATTVTEVLLPGLSLLHFECSRKSALVENFVEARLKSNLPIDVRHAPFPSWEVLDDASDTRSAVSV